MYQEVFPHTNQNSMERRGNVDGRLRQSTEQALLRLLKASHYAEDTARNPWDFAVTISELRRDGVGENELRWLVCRGYVEHANEDTSAAGNARTFDHHVSLRFSKQTAFIITCAGAKACRDLAHSVLQRDDDGNTNGEARSFDSAQPVATQLVEKTAPTTNGRFVPKWDRDRRELRIGGELVKVFKLPSPMQEAILMAFEEENWPPKIDDPLPSHPDLLPKRRLHDTIKSLNRNQKSSLIRFMGDGTGEGIRWELNLAGDDGEHLNLQL